MVEYQVLTEANGFGGWLENEDDLHTLEQAQAEMLRQEAVMNSAIEDGDLIHGEEVQYYVVSLFAGDEEAERIEWFSERTKKRMAVWDALRGAR